MDDRFVCWSAYCRKDMTDDERMFLLSVKSKNPDWCLLGMENPERIAGLPSVKWKLLNLGRIPDWKHKEAITKLEKVLKR